MKEEWKPAIGYEGLYEVSSHGRVKSLDRIKFNGKADYGFCGRVLSQAPSHGYRTVCLCSDKNRTKAVHRLVLEAFVGPCPAGMVACHNNGRQSENNVDNLRWDTQKNNLADMKIHGTLSRGERHGSVKLTEGDVLNIRELCKDAGLTQREIARCYGVVRSTVTAINTGQTWSWLE